MSLNQIESATDGPRRKGSRRALFALPAAFLALLVAPQTDATATPLAPVTVAVPAALPAVGQSPARTASSKKLSAHQLHLLHLAHVKRKAKASKAISARRAKVISRARSAIGVRYRWGGTSPRTGFDCSGYTQWTYKAVKVKLPRTAHQQMRHLRSIRRSSAKPGDLIFWVRGGRATHVAIYAGNGRMYASPRKGLAVRLQPVYGAPVFRRALR